MTRRGYRSGTVWTAACSTYSAFKPTSRPRKGWSRTSSLQTMLLLSPTLKEPCSASKLALQMLLSSSALRSASRRRRFSTTPLHRKTTTAHHHHRWNWAEVSPELKSVQQFTLLHPWQMLQKRCTDWWELWNHQLWLSTPKQDDEIETSTSFDSLNEYNVSTKIFQSMLLGTYQLLCKAFCWHPSDSQVYRNIRTFPSCWCSLDYTVQTPHIHQYLKRQAS